MPKKPPLLDRPGEGNYNRYYGHVNRECDEGRSFSHDRRSGPSHRGVCKFPHILIVTFYKFKNRDFF